MESGACAQIQNSQQLGFVGGARIQHDNLAYHVHGDEQAMSFFGHAHELWPPLFRMSQVRRR
jgi:hypothetical protein